MTKPIPTNMTGGLNDLLGFQLVEWHSGYAVLEVELDDGVVEFGILEEDALGFSRIDFGALEAAAAQGEAGFVAPALGDGLGIEVFGEEEFAGDVHLSFWG